jgi:UDP-glucose 4-epimerase
MKYLVTGGCGFIGSHLVEKLLSQGNEVFVIDDLSTGDDSNVRPHLDNPSFHLFIDTIINVPLVEELVKKSDGVFHLAAAVGVKNIIENPVNSIITNVEGTYNVLKNCVNFNKKILITSTSEIYGKNENIPFNEDADIIIGSTKKKRWSYACTKALDEFLALAFHEEEKLPVVIVRLFNTVGPRQSHRYGMVIPRFIKQAIAGEPITVFGSGEQSRCFLHVKDAVKAIVELFEKEEAVGDVFNIGSENEIKIKQLAFLIKEITASSSEIQLIDPEKIYTSGFEDMQRRVPDIGKIKKLINFQPRYTLEDIIRESAEYIKKTG